MSNNHNTIPVFDKTGKKVAEERLASEILSKPVNLRLIAQYVRVYLANQREGNAHTKTRSEVIGTTQKVYRQKGTGRARHGSKKAALFTGGGVTFGPRAYKVTLKMNKKQKIKALCNALHIMLEKERILAINESINTLEMKTKVFAELLKTLSLTNKKVLFILNETTQSAMGKALANIEKVRVITAHSINAYTILNTDSIITTLDALETINTHFVKDHE